MIFNSDYWENTYQNPSFTGSQDYDGWLSAYAEDIRPGSRVLDLGCGTGTNLGALLDFGANVTAADFSSNAVERIRDMFGSRLNAVDCFDMRTGFPYVDESFDLVVADLSLHYFSHADTCAIIEELRRILCSGGRLIARVHSIDNLPNPHAEKIEDNYYIVDGFPRRYFTMDEIRCLFAGWKILRLDAHSICRYHRQKQVIEFAVQKI